MAALSSMLLENETKNHSNNNNDNYAPSIGDGMRNSVPSAAYSSGSSSSSSSANSGDGDDDMSSAKESMMNLFGVPKMNKSGQPSKVKTLPSVWELQTVSYA